MPGQYLIVWSILLTFRGASGNTGTGQGQARRWYSHLTVVHTFQPRNPKPTEAGSLPISLLVTLPHAPRFRSLSLKLFGETTDILLEEDH